MMRVSSAKPASIHKHTTSGMNTAKVGRTWAPRLALTAPGATIALVDPTKSGVGLERIMVIRARTSPHSASNAPMDCAAMGFGQGMYARHLMGLVLTMAPCLLRLNHVKELAFRLRWKVEEGSVFPSKDRTMGAQKAMMAKFVTDAAMGIIPNSWNFSARSVQVSGIRHGCSWHILDAYWAYR